MPSPFHAQPAGHRPQGGASQLVASFVRTVFAHPDYPSARAQLERVADGLRTSFPRAAELLEEAGEDLFADFHFPEPHRRRLASTNPLEPLHKEIKRRTNVIGIHPNRETLLGIVGMVLAEQDYEWAVADRRYFSQKSMDRIYAPEEGGEANQEVVAAIAYER
jgi:putative transposase